MIREKIKYNAVRWKLVFCLVCMLFLFNRCVEPYEFASETFEEILVVEATITDQDENQEINLSTSFPLEEEGPAPETGARVIVLEEGGSEFEFEETAPGVYHSVITFEAAAGKNYRLQIVRENGKSYTSDHVQLAQSNPIDEVYARRTTFRGDDGVSLQVNTSNPETATRYFRYEYEETYKIVSRYSSYYDLEYIEGRFIEVPKTREEQVCYNTVASNEIILANTQSLNQNNLQDFLVRFVDSENPVLSRRYSILVKQYAISRAAFAYYETRKKLSGADNLFSQNQPGFVAGNIFAEDNADEKVIGFFNVSSVSSKRIFFNFADFYDENQGRPYFSEDCNPANPPISPLPDALVSLLESGYVKYLGKYPPQEGEGPYRVVEAECVDCNLYGTNEVPEFWED